MDARESSDVIGTIEWEITDVPTGETIHRGKRDLGRDDVEIVELPRFLDQVRDTWSRAPLRGKIYLAVMFAVAWAYGALVGLVTGTKRGIYRKRVHLDGPFYLDLHNMPSARRLAFAGFSLAAEHETVPTFSSEWFRVGGDGERGTGLQETRGLRIALARGVSGEWEVGQSEFLTDVSFMMEPKDGAGWKDSEPRWRVRIAEGSRVTWPSVDGASGKA